MNDPLVFTYSNNSEKKLQASLTGLFSEKNIDMLNLQTSQSLHDFDAVKTRLFIFKNPIHVNKLRIMFTETVKEIYFKSFLYQKATPFGTATGRYLFNIGDFFDPSQYQTGMVDVENLNFSLNGYSSDIIFELEPKDNITIASFSDTIVPFPEHDMIRVSSPKSNKNNDNGRIRSLTPFHGIKIIVENNTIVDTKIDLFNKEQYDKHVKSNGEIKIYIANGVSSGVEDFGEINTTSKEYRYFENLEKFMPTKYDVVKILNPYATGFNNIKINNEQEYDIETCNEDWKKTNAGINFSVNEVVRLVKIKETNISSFITTIPANTKIMFSFGIVENILKANKPNPITDDKSKS